MHHRTVQYPYILLLLCAITTLKLSQFRPFYLPREFTNIYITVLYIPPSADKTLAKEYVNNLCNDLANEKPDSLQIFMGDTNRCKLKLPNFTQYVLQHKE